MEFWLILLIGLFLLVGYFLLRYLFPWLRFEGDYTPLQQPKYINVPVERFYKGSKIVTEPQLKKLNSDFIKNRLKFEDSIKVWFHVQLPSRNFEYTSVICTNDSFKGVLHSFVRHWDQWTEYVPALNAALNKCGPIREHLKIVKNAAQESAKNAAQNELTSSLESLKDFDKNAYQNVQSALLKAQYLILQFLWNNTKQHQYLPEKSHDFAQLYFKVKNKQNQEREMVLIVSDKIFPKVNDFNDVRSVRPIITVYFVGK